MKKWTICILAAASIVSTTSAFGAVKEGSFSLSPLVGGYIFGDNQQFNSSTVLGVRAGYSLTKAFGFEALYDYVIPTDSKYWGVKDIAMQRFGGQALYHFIPDNQLVPYLAAGATGVKFSGSGINPHTHLSFDYGVGAKYFVTDDIAMRADLRHILYGYNNTRYDNVEFMLGASFQFGSVAPAVKAVSPMPVVAVAQTAATEPVRAAAYAPAVCPPIPKPVVCAPATETVKTVIAPVTREACEPFFIATAVKTSPAAAAMQTCTVPADTTVLFSYEKNHVKAKYYEELDKIGNFLKSFPGARVTIEGHTSAMGDKDANLKLSQSRADNVKSHIVYKFGIDGSRIVTKGYGLTRPVASNKTTLGRIQNRRIVAVFSCE